MHYEQLYGWLTDMWLPTGLQWWQQPVAGTSANYVFQSARMEKWHWPSQCSFIGITVTCNHKLSYNVKNITNLLISSQRCRVTSCRQNIRKRVLCCVFPLPVHRNLTKLSLWSPGHVIPIPRAVESYPLSKHRAKQNRVSIQPSYSSKANDTKLNCHCFILCGKSSALETL